MTRTLGPHRVILQGGRVVRLSGLYAAACAFKLRDVAERACGMALERFTHLLVRAKGQGEGRERSPSHPRSRS